jgi:UDP-N-acetylmuramate dehydrogenase|tara:strand:- start:15252 stop:16178 length:927 start_codon:yes stop_codon:yes gene_type:complete
MNDSLLTLIEKNTSAKVVKNEPLKRHTTYRIGGPAELMVFPKCKNDLLEIIKIAKKMNQPVTILGSGSNILISDLGITGVVVSLKNTLKEVEVDNEKMYAECGAMLGKIVRKAIKNDLIGLENLNGVPGTLGGALIMNAGAWGGEISENLVKVELIDNNGELKYLKKNEINFSYRHSSFNEKDILLSAEFLLEKADKEAINKNFVKAQSGRKSTQPLNKRSAGSLFKNPEGRSAGKLIDETGLKGFSIGDAKISDKHANFFINEGNASSKDMLLLIKKAHQAVLDKYQISLELEVKLMGFDKSEVQGL